VTRPPWLGAETAAPTAARRNSSDVPDAVRQLVYRRAGNCCESCGTPLRTAARHLHHRRPRGMGGTRPELTHRASNLLALCPDCHVLVETYRTQALDAGLLVRQGAHPDRVPVLLHDGGQWLLTDGGEYLDPDDTIGGSR
jgi:5-methylcytosine-specific restriction endonuclease McrA